MFSMENTVSKHNTLYQDHFNDVTGIMLLDHFPFIKLGQGSFLNKF